MRLFTAIIPPLQTLRALEKMQKGVSGAWWSSTDKLHITLGYFGDVNADQAELVDTELGRIPRPSFDLRLGGVGHFGYNHPHAIWAGVERNAELTGLYKVSRRAARYAKVDMEVRKYTPHVTLAYMKAHSPLDRIIAWEQNWAQFKSLPFLVDRFYLISSHPKKSGPNLYRKEACYPLLGHRLLDS